MSVLEAFFAPRKKEEEKSPKSKKAPVGLTRSEYRYFIANLRPTLVQRISQEVIIKSGSEPQYPLSADAARQELMDRGYLVTQNQLLNFVRSGVAKPQRLSDKADIV